MCEQPNTVDNDAGMQLEEAMRQFPEKIAELSDYFERETAAWKKSVTEALRDAAIYHELYTVIAKMWDVTRGVIDDVAADPEAIHAETLRRLAIPDPESGFDVLSHHESLLMTLEERLALSQAELDAGNCEGKDVNHV